MTRNEIKLFLTFFITYAFFIHWIGSNENTNFFLTRVIVDEFRFEIDNYYNQTIDRAYYNNHYYSDKTIGLSFFAIPTYAVNKYLYLFFFGLSDEIPEYRYVTSHNEIIADLINLNPRILVSMIFVTIFTSSLFSSLTVVLIYKISARFLENNKLRIILALIYGFGTLVFPYALVFESHATETFFVTLAIYVLFNIQKEKKDYSLLLGVIIGLGIISGLSTSIILIPIFLLFLHKKHFFWKCVLGCLIGISPMFIYNILVFGNPVTFSDLYIDTTIWEEYEKDNLILGFKPSLPNIFIMYRLTFDTYRGLFFYHPVLLISLFGLIYMWKKHRSEFVWVLFSLISFIIIFSTRYVWWGGSSFGVRHFVPLMSLLFIPLIFFVSIFEKNRILMFVLYALAFISIFHNFLGLSDIIEWHVEKIIEVESKLQEIYSFKSFSNPLYGYYLPKFLEHGARSRILEYFLINKIPDIREANPIPIEEIKIVTLKPFGILVLKTQFLTIIILLFTIFLIWKKELFNSVVFNKMNIGSILLILTILLLTYRLQFKNLVYDKNWYPVNENNTFRYMSKNASIYLYSSENTKSILNLSLSNYLDRSLDIYFNDKLVGNYSDNFSILKLVDVKRGENPLKLISKNGCDKPYITENSSDSRCLSFGLRNIETSNIYNKFLYSDNWYPEYVETSNKTYRWLSNDAIAYLIFNESEFIRLNLTFWSFDKDRTLEIYIDDTSLGNYTITENKTKIITPPIYTNKKWHTFKFHAPEGCDILNEQNKRCVSIALSELKIEKIKFNNNETSKFLYYDNWYLEDRETNKQTFKWLENNATLHLIYNQPGLLKLNLTFWSFDKDRTLEIYIDDTSLGNYTITENKTNIVTPSTYINKGNHILRFHAPEGCDILGEKDKRCVSVALSDLRIIQIGRISQKFSVDTCNKSYIIESSSDSECLSFILENIRTVNTDRSFLYLDNWYSENLEMNNKTYRWLGSNATIIFVSNNSGSMSLNLTFWSFDKDRTLEIYIDDTSLGNYTITENKTNIVTPSTYINKGNHILRFHAPEGCDILGEKDKRCVSVALSDLRIIQIGRMSSK